MSTCLPYISPKISNIFYKIKYTDCHIINYLQLKYV